MDGRCWGREGSDIWLQGVGWLILRNLILVGALSIRIHLVWRLRMLEGRLAIRVGRVARFP